MILTRSPRVSERLPADAALLRTHARLDGALVNYSPPNETALTWLTLRDDTALARLRNDWSRLAQSCDAGLFRSPEWIECWRTTLAPDAQPRVLTGWDTNGRVRVIWPLGLVRRRNYWFSWRSLEPMGEAVASGDRLEPLSDVTGCTEHLIGELSRVSAEADVLRCCELSADHEVVTGLQVVRRGSPMRVSDERVLPVIDLPHDWNTYTSTISAKLVGHVERQERAAIKRRGMTWKLNDAGESLEASIEGFMAMHQRCWLARGEAGNFSNAGLAAFLRAFAYVAHRRGWLRLHRLCDGSKTIAALFALHFGRRAYYYQSGWDPAVAALSPGSLCVAQAIRGAIDEGLFTFDFLRGDEPYKRRWSNEVEHTLTLTVPMTRTGRVLLRSIQSREIAKRVIGPAAWSRLKRWTAGVRA